MGKREDYEAKTEQLIAPIIAANHVELFDVDYIKEGQDWYLRVYIDKEGGVTIDDPDKPHVLENAQAEVIWLCKQPHA